jgi:Flp pilus assembly protein TadD
MPTYKQNMKATAGNAPTKMMGSIAAGIGRAASQGDMQSYLSQPQNAQLAEIMQQSQPQSAIAGIGSAMGTNPATPAPTSIMPEDNNPFTGQKFEISPVQMKGSFSPLSMATAEGIYGNSEQRQMSVARPPFNPNVQTEE